MMASEVLLDPYDIKSWSPLDSNGGGKKTWEELRKCVRDTMKLLTSLAGSVPSNFSFRTVTSSSGKLSRLYFLGIPSKGRENTLLYADILEDEHDKFVLPWKPVIDNMQPSWSSGQLSKEEQLMRERKRLGSYGITSYDFVEDKGRFVFTANSSLYMCEDMDMMVDLPVIPTLLDTQCIGARLDPKFCPVAPDYVAFINSGDIWVTYVNTFNEMQLTHTQTGESTSLEENPISAGAPSFVVQEEFDRYTGYWWQPVLDNTSAMGYSTLRILYEEVDETDVEILHIFAPSTNVSSSGVDEYRYPRAGTANARSTLKVVEFHVNSSGLVKNSRVQRCLVEPLSVYCPWAEYLVRAGWTPNGKFAYAQLMDRSQQHLCLLLIPLECFVPVSEDDVEMHSFDHSKYPPVQCIYEETSSIWINVHDVLHFFPQEFENQISFLWSSQKSGYRHLYYVTSQVIDFQETEHSDVDIEDKPAGYHRCQMLKEVQLTSGELGSDWKTDEERKLIYFMGTKDTPLELHLYMMSYDKPSEPLRLTEPGYSHAVALSSDYSMFVTTYSSVDTPPQSAVISIHYSGDGSVFISTCCTLMEPPVCPNYRAPELFNFTSSHGSILYGMFYRPHNYRPGMHYPTVLFVYGGPQVQLVNNSFKGLKFLRLHTLASQGYAVVMVDGRGSCNRGLAFEGYIKNSLGVVEMDDQVEGLKWLAANTDFIDLNRVAIHGWSYGGYLALMGLAQRPDVFKVYPNERHGIRSHESNEHYKTLVLSFLQDNL
ncbi:hypothetical protein C0Q70_03386 [Pomacea canaliculata]|uniref:Dipeptidyl peptidase 9 n=1 Tax=Pomacea canaliculata TaxID=400727 RepID=A0A2T7PSJ9_POMCA|nr:hypothetical protein C0Q70_03386 [Pomacea canaliculata]